MKRICLELISSILLAAFSSQALAWDGVVNGKITQFEISNGQNFAFRVIIGGQAMCNSGQGWAYLNESDSNYKVYVANLMAAKLAGTSVTVFTVNEGGYCKIGHLYIN